MSVKHALLALLADGPRYGYDLKSAFERATGDGWSLNIGQVYSTLQRLERDELIKPDGPPDSEGRQSYLLSAAGRETVEAWLATPMPAPGADRDDLSMKVLIAVATDIVAALDVVSGQRLAAMGHLQMLTSRKAAFAGQPEPELATRLHLDRTIMLAESQIRWLDLVEQRLEAAGELRPEPGTHARLESASPSTSTSPSPNTRGTS